MTYHSFKPYRKCVAALVTGVIGWATAVVASAPAQVSASEWVFGATVVATAFGVYRATNS